MITTNIYNRVFFIRAAQYGTAFTIDVDNRQYLVTARHLLGDNQEVAGLLFMHEKSWQALPAKLVGVSRREADIAVLASPIRLSPAMALEPTTEGIVVGQDVYSIGYPYMMWTDGGAALGGRPVPFIKKGILSSALDHGDGLRRLFVDSMSNVGFSGGPVVFKPQGSDEFRVAGVVSAFKTQPEPVMDKSGEPTGMTVAYNTGFLIANDIHYAVEVIKANPIGFLLAD